MIKILGFKRVATIASLVAMIVVLLGAYYYLLLPQKDKVERELSRERSAVAKTREETDRLKLEFEQLVQQKGSYDNLLNLGFFNAQDRVLARERFDIMQKLSKVLSAEYEIQSASIEESEEAEKAGYRVLNSSIGVRLEGLDDIDIYRFLYLVNYSFPGHTTIKNLKISRETNVTQPVLRQIGSGVPIVMVVAEMDIDWRTMVKQEELDSISRN